MKTRTDDIATEWAIRDDVSRLRIWGTDVIHPLPRPPVNELEIGAAADCALCLVDKTNRVSRHHARAEREPSGWVVRDTGSKNGIRLDGARRPIVPLQPGVELGIGGLTLIAESERSIELHGFLSRLLGWTADRLSTVDLALRALRLAATSRAPLELCGDGDLVPIAQSIHWHTLGAERPFILCDPRRRKPDATARSAENILPVTAAFEAARGGTLCVWSSRMPRDFEQVRAAVRTHAALVQVIVCMEVPTDGSALGSTRITIPPLSMRMRELPRIIDEYASEACSRLGVAVRFGAPDRAWIASHSASSLLEIEKGTRRLVALRHTLGNVTEAAELLGMGVTSLRTWLDRRALPEIPEPHVSE